MRCTNFTLKAFGIEVEYPIQDFRQMKKVLKENGYEAVWLPQYWNYIDRPISSFMDDFLMGMYIIGTSQHSMAYINGVLYDTANGTKRRKVDTIYVVTKI